MAVLTKRAYDDDYGVNWWYSDTAAIVKWAVFLSLGLILLLWVVGGYIHAKKRIQKGLVPLAYHRWLINRRTLAQVDPRYAQQTYYHPPPAGYQMHSMPPPVYDPSRPPVYEATENMSKVNPTQNYQPPPGPPPPPMNSMQGELQPSASGNYQAPPGPPVYR